MLKVYKEKGITPLELLNNLREKFPDLKTTTLSYAGRLDPMAEGEMLILVGKEENQNRKKYLNFDKTYEAEILFGFATDTFDILGMIEKIDYEATEAVTSKNLRKTLDKIKTIQEIEYPAFSSKRVQGKALFEWKKSGQINKIKIPKRQVKIKKCKLIETQEINGEDLLEYLENSINKVQGNFRQKQVLTKWKNSMVNLSPNLKKLSFKVAKLKFKVTSGTYIRTLSQLIGQDLDVPTTLLNLKRIKIHNPKFFF